MIEPALSVTIRDTQPESFSTKAKPRQQTPGVMNVRDTDILQMSGRLNKCDFRSPLGKLS